MNKKLFNMHCYQNKHCRLVALLVLLLTQVLSAFQKNLPPPYMFSDGAGGILYRVRRFFLGQT
jgi:hypothetical protein